VSTVTALPDPSTASALSTSAAPWPALGALCVGGPDATSFLNNQFTSHVAAQPDRTWRWSAWCSPKGRVRTTFRLARLGDTWWLMLPAALIEPTLAGLKKYVMRSKVALSASPIGVGPVAVAAAAAPGSVSGDASAPVWHLADARALGVVADRPASVVDATDVLAGAPWVAGDAVEQFLPQMLGLDALGGIRSGAGCYPGQEIVTRTDTLGEVKRVLYRFELAATTEPPAPGTVVRSAGANAAGPATDPAVDAPQALAGHVLHAARAPSGAVIGLAVLDRTRAGEPLAIGAARLASVERVASVHPSA
jgi:hypothetical protein